MFFTSCSGFFSLQLRGDLLQRDGEGLLYGTQVALNLAPLLHRDLSLATRCEVGLCGFVAVDLFRMVAEEKTTEMGMPTGSGFMAAQTCSNLQSCALAGVLVTLTLDEHFQPWKFGNARLSELPIEQWFSFLRSQSPNAQLSSRAFWQAAGRVALRTGQALMKEKPVPSGFQSAIGEEECLDLIITLYFLLLSPE